MQKLTLLHIICISLQVCLNDKIAVDVHNNLVSESTSLHWHGHHQVGSPHMDGVPHVTQCPISPGTTFRYTFNADSPGTHFWHSHSGLLIAN
jgi:L-ascorbate oxidase